MKINVFGDSHCIYLEVNEKLKFHAPWVLKHNVNVHKIKGASVVGLGRERSSLNVKSLVDEYISEDAVNVFCFGQVDMELGFYYKKVVKRESVSLKEFALELATQYEKFLGALSSKSIVVKGLNLTVLKSPAFAHAYIRRIVLENIKCDDAIKEHDIFLKESLESFSERNNATLLFNKKMQEICTVNNWKYFDINDHLSEYSPGKGVSDKFIPGGFDHHVVDSIEMRKVHLSKLFDIIN